jgi:hypothetical protein
MTTVKKLLYLVLNLPDFSFLIEIFFSNSTFHIFIRGCEVEFYNEQDLKIKNADGKNGKR